MLQHVFMENVFAGIVVKGQASRDIPDKIRAYIGVNVDIDPVLLAVTAAAQMQPVRFGKAREYLLQALGRTFGVFSRERFEQ